MRFVIGLLSAALLTPASRGDDDLCLRVKVALALACDCGKCGDAKKDAKPAKAAGALDWFVSAASKVEDSPAPKVAPKKAKPAAPAPAAKPAAPARRSWALFTVWDGRGRTWYEWRPVDDPAPAVMPAPAVVAPPPPIDWQVYVPPVFDPFRECVGTA